MNLFDDAPFGLPSFIQEMPAANRSSGPFGQFVFWSPDRTDDEVLDHALGRQHFDTALTFAHAIQSNTFLAFVFGGICRTGPNTVGAMERGFVDALSVKATYGCLPDRITGNEALELLSACGTTEDEVRFGEVEARDYLTLARETQCPEVVSALMESIVYREMERGSLSFMWTVCGAAYLGAMN